MDKHKEQSAINRRVRLGYNRQESEKLLQELLLAHSGLNLSYALTYNGFEA